MLTGFGSEEIAVHALHKGAIDYIPKDSLSKHSIWGLIKAALETWKRKRAEEGLKRKYLFSKPQDYTDFHEKTII
jgi:FixJ family two-component response regulator